MSFFYAPLAAKAKAPKKVRVQDIPVSSLQALGCSVCPRDKDDLASPKMRPSGPEDARVYLLGSAPSEEEDEDNNHWTDKAGNAIYQAFGKKFMQANVRSNFVTQCRGDQTAVEIECCRPRVVADIEAVKPLLVVGIGDAPLRWVTGVTSGALTHRGSLFVTKIGAHVCWFYSILYPNYVHKKSFGKSEYELALEHDVARVKELVRELPSPSHYNGPYDDGIEYITGNQPGDLARLAQALSELAREPRSALDIETTGLRPYMLKDAHILTCAVGTFKRTLAFALDHPDGWGSAHQRKQAKALFFNYLLDSGRKCCHHVGFEMEWLAHEFGASMLRRTEWDDTMAQAHTLDERPGTLGLDLQCRRRFGFFLKAQSRVDVRRPEWWLQYSLEETLRYNGMDTKWTDLLRDTLAPEIAVNPKYQREYDRKVRLAPTLTATETIGLPVDFEYAEKMHKHFTGLTAGIEKKLAILPEVREYQQRFGTFSATNPEHVLKLMKDVCKRDEVRVEDKRSGTIRWTSDEEALAKIPSKEVPSAALILEHRGASKLVSTYIDPVLERKIVCPDDLIRCKYGSMVAVTGRLNSEDPNIQNWPKRKHKEVRGILRALFGQWLTACDYGQIEFRVVGMASEDENLVKYCWTGYDVHKYWAERMVKVYPPVVDWVVDEFEVDWDKEGLKTLRQEAKNGWVFPQLFGSSTQSCADRLHLPREVGAQLGEEFWDEFPQVKKWQEGVLAKYQKNLYVETLTGRKRRGPQTPNEIINLPIQGTAADIVLEGMCALSEKAEMVDDPELQPVLNVHDDLTFMLADASLDTKIEIIAREMCLPRFDFINVPLVVEVSVGERWNELKEIRKYWSNKLFNTPNPYEEKQ